MPPEALGPPRKRAKKSSTDLVDLSGKVARLTSDLEQMKALLESLKEGRGPAVAGDPDQGQSTGVGALSPGYAYQAAVSRPSSKALTVSCQGCLGVSFVCLSSPTYICGARSGPVGGLGNDAYELAVGHFTPDQLSRWNALVSDQWVVSTVTRGYVLQFCRRPPVPSQVRMAIIRDQVKAQALSDEIDALLAKGAILPVNPLQDPGGFYSTYLDMRGLNVFVKIILFHMLSIRDVLQTISPGDWFTLVDLRDTYLHVPIAPHHCQFLRFPFQGKHFQFRVLPFGLSLSPRVFTRCVAAALYPLQARGLKILPYLDDWLICAPTEAQAAADTQTLLHHIDLLGLRVNWQKSNLAPSQVVTFLGIMLDSLTITACPSPQRVEGILKKLPAFLPGRAPLFIAYLHLLGKLTATATVVPLGLLSLRPLQMRLSSLGLDPSRALHRRRRLRVSLQCLASLAQWRDAVFMTKGVPLGSLPSRREVVSTDTSTTGWGALWQQQIAQGTWSQRDKLRHINALELEAVRRALHFLSGLHGRHVLVRSDSTAVVFYINHQGGTRSITLLRLTQMLLTWAAPLFASLRAAHIPGMQNGPADILSRGRPPLEEWRLHLEVVGVIWEKYSKAAVDLFASQESTHCPLWFSLADFASPLGQDTLAHDWPRGLLYAFPLLSLLGPTLLRVLQEGQQVLLVAPFWPGRTWFPLLHRLCCSSPMPLPLRKDLLSQMGGRILHPNPSRLCLWVWPLRGPVSPSHSMTGTSGVQ
ncbi:uncharacterized protein LOC119616813 [Kryptolebias marmoratus]|uniref:uncharacterized protein LOC119616813 n=1 Tax=Kryptolebias marmoratus TaxID=37003 RepID=UPI0007F8A1BD|nr:uncharacterized protein LOC119616813 [Kryptolebias marmoratus]